MRPSPVVPLLSGLALVAAIAPGHPQVIPDRTLGSEGTVVSPGIEVRGSEADLVEGGAQRGSNLFHSFQEFNIDAGQRLYFASPAGVESILSRITGGNPSAIFGTLGVDGTADLFLINPNGLVFGETATLDIQGSFHASTAEAIPLGNGVYSATAPEQSSLLTVNPSAFFSTYLSESSGNIESRAALAAGENLTLAANQLDLQRQVAAGGDLTLLGNTVQIRDRVNAPFVGFAGGDLLVQGNEQVDIVALSHPDSGLYSYGDMVLRSRNPVGGDAHYWSGGNFRVETLDGSGGSLFSPIDPIIRSLGDVFFEVYVGSSLHILAGGSVAFDTAFITDPDPGVFGIDFLQETITLSDGTVVQVDGGAQPTLDLRAGVSPELFGTPPIELLTGFDVATDAFDNLFLEDIPLSANIVVGDVFIAAPNGLVLLTNQYQPNTNLSGGNISIIGGSIFSNSGINVSRASDQGGAVYLDARGDVFVINSFIDTTSVGAVGDIVINADSTVRIDGTDGSRDTGIFANISSAGAGTGGNIRINSGSLEVLNGALINASVFGNGQGGNIELNIRGTASFAGVNLTDGIPSGVSSTIQPGGIGAGGNIQINASVLEVLDGAQILASTFGIGNSGNIRIDVDERVYAAGFNPIINNLATGILNGIASIESSTGGNIEISTKTLELFDGAQISTSIFGMGNAGNVILNVTEQARLVGSNRTDGGVTGVISSVQPGSEGRGGNVQIIARNLEVLNGAALSTETSGRGNAGSMILTVAEQARFEGSSTTGFDSGAFSLVGPNGAGSGGTIQILARNLEVLNGAILSASTFGSGDAGSINLNIAELVRFVGFSPVDGNLSGAFSSVEPGVEGVGGNIRIRARNLEVLDGAVLNAATFGLGDAGSVILDISELARFSGTDATGSPSGAFSSVQPTGEGKGGNIQVRARNLEILQNATLDTTSSGIGNAGNIDLTTLERLLVNNGTIATFTVATSGGQVNIQAGQVVLRNDGDIQTFVGRGEGGGGNITIASNFLIALEDSDILAFSADGRGGIIDLSRTTFFGQNPSIAARNLSLNELLDLDGNDRVDINATGGIESGQIFVGDATFVENSLTALTDAIVDTSALTAGSCIARSQDSLGAFVVTGRDGLPATPGDGGISAYPTGTVRTGDEPIATGLQEPDGVYQLPNGRLVLSRACN
ncbi:filamentous hemagglutinin N-terminal domain-containing protein [Nodosilinea sp. PGN35]|uniref:two-partner secretion domain-containing protein n=1 Tax=Nodosilinea sp. PGN35 TaxID=3020489 RepID=UPI0023B21BB7|nr:filamentous hemagglutinin N-terminal domain-containing protein [Nodosilinea sp. TSF1-S3]MDF0366770.1 filamentous hemagglutinin N-terminal domain-containing protein [Nodosilinea sp. TSF1-S3]